MQLSVTKRTIVGKIIKNIRKDGQVPAVVYGKHLKNSYPISFEKNSFLKLYKQVGNSIPLTLSGEGVDNELVLVHDLQVHPVSSKLLHVDFLAVRKDQKVATNVEIILEGKAQAEKDNIGRVQLVVNDLTVEAFPQDLPRNIIIDISGLAHIHDAIQVKDINLGSKVTIKADPEQPVVTVVEIKEEKEETPAAAAATPEAGAAAAPAAPKA